MSLSNVPHLFGIKYTEVSANGVVYQPFGYMVEVFKVT